MIVPFEAVRKSVCRGSALTYRGVVSVAKYQTASVGGSARQGPPLRVAVVGAGVAGPATATLLARQGCHVDVFERANPLTPVGAGLLLQPTGMHVLHRLGLLEEALSLGHRIDSLVGDTDKGRPVLELAYADLDAKLFGLGMHRGALFAMLLAAMSREPLVRVHAGLSIVQVHQGHSHVTLRAASGQMLGPYDLLVIADGARSRLREQLSITTTTTPYAYAAAWFTVPMPAHSRWHGTLRQVYRDTRSMVGYLPVGKPARDVEPTMSVFWSLPANAIEATRAAGLVRFERELISLDPHTAVLMMHLRDMQQVVFATYHDTVSEQVFHHRAVLLGDAAHAMSPQLGQGANLALVDAASLSDAIAKHPYDVCAALAAHDERRRDHVAFYARASRWLTPWFQSPYAALAMPRDLLMHRLSRVAWVRRQMAESLAGLKTGVFSAYPMDF